jgi:hypothetical protein
VTAVAVNGAPLPASTVEQALRVTHGRADITAAGQPSTAAVALLIGPGDPIPAGINDLLTVSHNGQPRFTGTVIDVQLEHFTGAPDSKLTRVLVSAIGYLDRLNRINVATTAFLEATFVDRATAVLEATGLTYAISQDDGTILLADPADTNRDQTVRDYLQTLCATVGATMTDLPDGTILLETYTRRAANYTGGAWAMADMTWADYEGTWGSARVPVALPANAVMWEPTWWMRRDTILNDVTVAYGAADPKDVAHAADSISIAKYGQYDVYLDTTMKLQADAEDRAAAVLTAQAMPHWNMSDVAVMVDQLDAATLTDVMNLESGDRVVLTGLPAAAPSGSYMGVVEGWGQELTPDAHVITLHLSDPRYSFAMAEWGEISGTLTWGAVRATTTWADAVLPYDLI